MAATAETVRVTQIGGIVSAAAWDFAGGLPSNRMFYDTVAALDPEAGFRQGLLRAVKPARHMISTMTP